MAGSPLAARAVGQILKKNFDSNIPCHRVVGASDLGGYNRGKEKKILILIEEGVDIKSLLARRQILASDGYLKII